MEEVLMKEKSEIAKNPHDSICKEMVKTFIRYLSDMEKDGSFEKSLLHDYVVRNGEIESDSPKERRFKIKKSIILSTVGRLIETRAILEMTISDITATVEIDPKKVWSKQRRCKNEI